MPRVPDDEPLTILERCALMADEAVAELRLVLAATANVFAAHDSGDGALLDESVARLREICESIQPNT